jgi:pimeloyl-ACP methyl ester carboxylesterase
MNRRSFTGVLLALSLVAPAFCASAKYDVGSLGVEQLEGKGPPVVLIPGLASGAWVWADTAARLRTTHSVYLLTLPGFDGRAPVAGITLDGIQDDLRALIESKHLKKPVLIGHSLGGTLSLAFAASHSDLIGGVIAVDGLPVFPGTESFSGDRSALAQRAHAQLDGQTREQFAAYQQTYTKQFGVLDEEQAKKLADLTSLSDVGATAEFAAQLLTLDLRPRLSAIKVRVLEISPFHAPDFAAMGVDEAGKTGYYRMLLNGIASLEVVSISPARHFVMFDQPEKFATALDAGLAKMIESAP